MKLLFAIKSLTVPGGGAERVLVEVGFVPLKRYTYDRLASSRKNVSGTPKFFTGSTLLVLPGNQLPHNHWLPFKETRQNA